ncbi:hypothetical protein DFR26_0600 [Paraperlucidibaca baekdonensis]|uniref:Collagen-like protein n=1 Tax=Paraperlucidibaca baekdonensis TaxID=748120 RepID=A0A3E0H9N2_9GAMM|nr:hypothetical protein [Paraperlucidibaca baekdonensis]REH40399.1 hypothetical protein DFR26_0600 [Paraperlucidibaca baekdonensis]
MNVSKLTRLAASCTLALGLAACGADGNSGSTGGGGAGGGGGGGNPTPPRLILDDTQTQLSGTLTGLGNAIGTDNPLGALVFCLDPTVNDLVDGPDALLTNLLGSLNTTLGTQDPAALQAALLASGDSLATALQSLTVNLPNALMALADPSAAANCGSQANAGGNGGASGPTGTPLDALLGLFSGGNNPFAGTPLEALGTLGGDGTPANGPTGTPLDVILGPLLAIQNGDNSGELVDQLGMGVQMLGATLTSNLPDQVVTAPIVGGVLTLLGDTLNDLGGVLNQVENPSTSQEVQNTLNNLLSNLTGTLIGLDPTGQLAGTVGPQIQGGIDQLVGSLGAILDPVAGNGGLVPTLTDVLAPLTCGLQLTGNCDGANAGLPGLPTGGDNPLAGIPLLGDLIGGGLPTGGAGGLPSLPGLPTGGAGGAGPISGALAGTPLAPIGGLLGLLGL